MSFLNIHYKLSFLLGKLLPAEPVFHSFGYLRKY